MKARGRLLASTSGARRVIDPPVLPHDADNIARMRAGWSAIKAGEARNTVLVDADWWDKLVAATAKIRSAM